MRENKFQSSEVLCKHRQNFIISFISPELSSVSYEVQHSFSTFGIVRNELFLEDIEKSPREVFNTMQIILVQGFCLLVTRICGGFRLNYYFHI